MVSRSPPLRHRPARRFRSLLRADAHVCYRCFEHPRCDSLRTHARQRGVLSLTQRAQRVTKERPRKNPLCSFVTFVRDILMSTYNRLSFVVVVALATVLSAGAAEDLGPIKQEITKRHDEAVKRLQDWIKLPSIAAENLNSAEGAEYMAKLAKAVGLQRGIVIQTDGKPGVFATLDAGAK